MKRNYQVKKLSDDDLIDLRIAIEKEFKKRKIKFETGEIGEKVAIDFFNKTPGLTNLLKAGTNTKNVDALSKKGERYSIKTIKNGNKTGTVYPDSENKKLQLFEFILVVILDEAYELQTLIRFSWSQFTKVRQWDKTMNAWYISKAQNRLAKGECIYEKK